MARGRKAVEDTTPGKILALALLACAPIAVAFIFVPLTGARPTRDLLLVVQIVTPIAAGLSVAMFLRAGERRTHRAARIGILLAGTALFLWALTIVPLLVRG